MKQTINTISNYLHNKCQMNLQVLCEMSAKPSNYQITYYQPIYFLFFYFHFKIRFHFYDFILKFQVYILLAALNTSCTEANTCNTCFDLQENVWCIVLVLLNTQSKKYLPVYFMWLIIFKRVSGNQTIKTF